MKKREITRAFVREWTTLGKRSIIVNSTHRRIFNGTIVFKEPILYSKHPFMNGIRYSYLILIRVENFVFKDFLINLGFWYLK